MVDGGNTLIDLLGNNSLNKRKFVSFVEKLASKDEITTVEKKSIAGFLQESGFSKLSEADQQRNLDTDGSSIGDNVRG